MQRLLNQHAKMGLRAKRRFLKSARKDCHIYEKNPDGLQLTANHPGFQFKAHFSASLSYV